MKKVVCFLFLILLLVSCSNYGSLYNKNYEKGVDILDSKKNIDKKDLLLKIKSLYAQNKIDEIRDTVVLYLFMASEYDERELPVDIFINMNFSDNLNVLILKETDSFQAQQVLFKSLYNLGQYDRAKNVLFNCLAGRLSVEQFTRILIRYPMDKDFIVDYFISWFKLISKREIDLFSELFNNFLSSVSLTNEQYDRCRAITEELKKLK